MKNIRFSEKLSSISMFSVFLNSLDIKYTQKYKGEEKKTTCNDKEQCYYRELFYLAEHLQHSD